MAVTESLELEAQLGLQGDGAGRAVERDQVELGPARPPGARVVVDAVQGGGHVIGYVVELGGDLGLGPVKR